ncbi:MAG: hypothetical protein EZS28_022133 [Streblomastix strix]|uniref:Uncharacterized protein n=1 Tax=Streblomastix strix TaxID=222440 RepID=A0A5J4VIP0_9EUKA|nr:MAG: hypothetical protein EZS28_022133 [Streblomastix strix]
MCLESNLLVKLSLRLVSYSRSDVEFGGQCDFPGQKPKMPCASSRRTVLKTRFFLIIVFMHLSQKVYKIKE